MSRQRATIVAAALALVAAAPASAVTGGFGVASTLGAQTLPVSTTVGGIGAKKHTVCEATGSRTSKRLMSQFEKQFVPVACEQPPRSLVLTSDAFRKATAAALSALG
jgi:hypothetical protein